MNYIIEINAFYEWLNTHQLSRSAIALWHALMHLDNKTSWRKSFTVAISVLQVKAGLKRAELFKARAELLDAGLITCTPREKQKSARYSMLPFYTTKGVLANRLPDADQDENSDENQDEYPVDSNENLVENEPKLNENTSKNDPDSKLNKNKPNIEQDKSCLSSGDDERHDQKDLFGNDSLSPEKGKPGGKLKKRMSEQDVLNLYNKICSNLPRAVSLPGKRKEHIGARMKEFDDDAIRRMLEQAANSDFLSNGFKSGWKANIDWLFRPNNFVKVLEGQYAYMRPAKEPLDDYIGKPSPLELLEEAYNGIMKDEKEY